MMKSGKSMTGKISSHNGKSILLAGLIAVLMLAGAVLMPHGSSGKVYASGGTQSASSRTMTVKFLGPEDVSEDCPEARVVFTDNDGETIVVTIPYEDADGSTVDLTGIVEDATYKSVHVLVPGYLTYCKESFAVPADLSTVITLKAGDINRATSDNAAASDDAVSDDAGEDDEDTAAPEEGVSDDALYNCYEDYIIGDGKINIHDHAALTEIFGSKSTDANTKYVEYADFNMDGYINLFERGEITNNFGKTVSD